MELARACHQLEGGMLLSESARVKQGYTSVRDTTSKNNGRHRKF